MADGDQTIVKTSDNRAKVTLTPNQSIFVMVVTATFDADDTTDVTLNIPINARIEHVTLAVPNTTNAITTQMQITDDGGNIRFDTGENAENDTYNFALYEPISESMNVVIGVSGAVGATGSVIVATITGE